MAELPSLLRVKRKRGQDPAPDLFLQEESTKRQQTWQFRLQQPHPSDTKSDDKGNNSGLPAPNLSAGVDAAAANGADIITSPVRREFRLAIDPSRTAIVGGRKRKAQVEAQDIPTFIEATNKKQRFDKVAAAPSDSAAAHIKDKPSASLKKPGASLGERQWRAENWKHPANQLTPQPPSTQAMDALQQFALEEAAREEVREKPRVTIVPKKPVRRYRDRHPEEFAAADSVKSAAVAHGHAAAIHEDMDMSDDDDYVYDTYVRSKDPVMPPTIEDADPLQYNVGYLVITEQDQPFWETYFEDDESEHEFETDDEDENAEGYYGADYPEDEVASDDEYGRGAYGYRNAASDDEQWDSDTGAFSDDGEVMQNPWKKYAWMQSSKDPAGLLDDDDEDENDGAAAAGD